MGRWTAERWAASSGIAFAILLLVSNFLTGTPPHYNASSDKIAAFVGDHHNGMVAQGVISGVLVVLWLWFLASYAGTFREGGQGRLATIMYGAGVVGLGLAAIGDAIMLSLAQLNSTIGADTVAALYGVSVFFYLKMFWAMAALALATWLANSRSHVFPAWFSSLSFAGGIVSVFGGLSIRGDGFFSPAGAMVWIAFLAFAAWVLVASYLCTQKQAAHAPAMSAAHSH